MPGKTVNLAAGVLINIEIGLEDPALRYVLGAPDFKIEARLVEAPAGSKNPILHTEYHAIRNVFLEHPVMVLSDLVMHLVHQFMEDVFADRVINAVQDALQKGDLQ